MPTKDGKSKNAYRVSNQPTKITGKLDTLGLEAGKRSKYELRAMPRERAGKKRRRKRWSGYNSFIFATIDDGLNADRKKAHPPKKIGRDDSQLSLKICFPVYVGKFRLASIASMNAIYSINSGNGGTMR